MKKKVLSLLLALAMCLSLSVPAWSITPPEDAFLEVCPYEEVNYATGDDALLIIENTETRQYYEKHISDMQLELEDVTTKSVYFEEGFNESGVFMSRMLNRAEVEQFKSTNVAPSLQNTSSGNATYAVRQLTITLSKSRDAHRNYVLNGYAEWNTEHLTNDGYTYPYPGEDYLAIRWGGERTLVATGCSFAGQYTDGSRMTGNLEKSDAYAGYCWAFDEKTATFGKVMDHASVVVVLDHVNSQLMNKQDGAILQYIHTYEEKKPTWHIEFDGESFSGGFTLNNCSKQWQLETDVTGIEY